MRSYKFEDIEKLAIQNGMRITSYGDIIHVFLGNFCVSTFGRVYPVVPQYELVRTGTNVLNDDRGSNLRNIYVTGFVTGRRFFGNLNDVYENVYKKYKEILKTLKAAEIKKAGAEYEIV